MSTQYKIIEKDGWTIEADERSSRVSLGITREVLELTGATNKNLPASLGDLHLAYGQSETDAVFTAEDLICAAVELVRVASYIADEPECTIERLNIAIRADRWLSMMPRKRRIPNENIKDTKDAPLSMGNGEYTEQACDRLLDDVSESLSLLSALQQSRETTDAGRLFDLSLDIQQRLLSASVYARLTGVDINPFQDFDAQW